MIKNLQSLRGIAAILIFCHHFGFSSVFAESFGDFGVTFFMMLSGFVLTLAYGGRVGQRSGGQGAETLSAGRFMLSRLVKIYPLYLLCWALAVAFLPYRGSREGVALSLVMLQSWVPEAEVYFAGNGVSWFISDLMFSYLMFIPLMMLSRRPAYGLTAAGLYFTAYFCAVMMIPERLVHGIVYINPLMQLSSFIIGMVLSRVYCHLRASDCFGRFRPGHVTLIEAVAIAAVTVAMWGYGGIPQRFSFGSYWWLPVGLAILVFALTDGRGGLAGSLLNQRPLLKLGEISFSFYLLHYLFIRAWRASADCLGAAVADMPLILQALIVVAVLSLVSAAVSRYFEVPGGRWLRKLLFH